MHRYGLIAIFCFWCLSVVAVEHENILTVSWGGIWQNDEYLSPLVYSDHYLALQNEWHQALPATDSVRLWTHTGLLRIEGERMYSPNYLNMMYGFMLRGGWGAEYNFSEMMGLKGFNIYLGPYLDALFCAREHLNNVNKPFSFDIMLLPSARAGISYSFPYKNTSYRIIYETQLGLLGLMFVPQYGESYYEISTGSNHGIVHFANPYNCLQFSQRLSFDMQFRHSAWRIGVEYNYGKQHANHLHFSKEQVALVIGTMFNFETYIRSIH